MTEIDPSARSFSATELHRLCDAVARMDPDLKRVVDTFGYPEFWHRPNTFESFVWFILEQQVSLASAKAALEKLRERVGTISPENVVALTDDEFRAAYFSRQKTAYVRGVAEQILQGNLDFSTLADLPDRAVREQLVQLKGVGNWTVDVYLIMVLHRIDLFPTGDLAVINGLKALKELPRETPAEALAAIARSWAPHRTIGTMLVWHYYLARRLPRARSRGPFSGDVPTDTPSGG